MICAASASYERVTIRSMRTLYGSAILEAVRHDGAARIVRYYD